MQDGSKPKEDGRLRKKSGDSLSLSGPDPPDRLTTKFALPLCQIDFADRISLTADQKLLASGTVCSLPLMAGDVADVYIFQTAIYGGLAAFF